MHRQAAQGELKAETVFDSLPAQLARPRKKFSPSLVEPGARTRSYADGIAWLTDAMIVNPCFRSSDPGLGLKLNRRDTGMKLYVADTGLLISQAFDERGRVPEELYARLLHGKPDINRGMLTENVVAQMLTAAGHKLYYYANADREDARNRMEIDFLTTKASLTNQHNICPIEIKSGNDIR